MVDYQRFNITGCIIGRLGNHESIPGSNFEINETENLKTLCLFHNSIVIKDDGENDKIIIDLSNIIEIYPKKENKKEVIMKYNSNGLEDTLIFYSDNRDALLSRIITMKDRSSKIISDYSIETFKCYNLIRIDTKLLKEIGQKLYEISQGKAKKNTLNSISELNKKIAFCTLYRTYSVINKLSDKELKTYYVDLSKIIKIKIAPNIYGLILDDINKIRIAIIPFNQKDVLTIKNLIISYASKYLSYEIKYEEKDDYLKEIPSDLFMNKAKSSNLQRNEEVEIKNQQKIQQNKNIINNNDNFPKFKNNPINLLTNLPKKSVQEFNRKIPEAFKEIKAEDSFFTYNNVKRILYYNNKSKIILKGYNEYILLQNVDSNEPDLRIKLNDIFIIVMTGEEEEYFEIILKGKSRFIFEIQYKNKIINDIIELLLKYYRTKNINENFLLLSYKTSFNKYIRKISNTTTINNLEERKIEEIIGGKEDFKEILEEIVFNCYFVFGISKQVHMLLIEPITKILIQKFDDCYNKCINDNEKDNKENIIFLNLFLIFFKNLGTNLVLNDNGKKIFDKIFEKLKKELEYKNKNINKEKIIILNDYALFYNTIHVMEYFSLFNKIMLLKVISFNNENAQEFNYNSMYLNFLLIIFQNKLLEMRELIDAFIPESNYFFFLLTFYKIFVYEPINVSRNAILFFSTILEKVSDKKQREIKDILLKKTLIFYALIRIFLINNNNDLLVTKYCLKIFQILLNQYYEVTKPIKNIFPATLIKTLGAKKDPDKWDKAECDKFFIDILRDYYEEKIIWNSECKKELIESLTNLIKEYEEAVEKKFIDSNPLYNEIKENNIKLLINIIFNHETFDNLDTYPKKGVEYKPLYCIDYQNFKVNYNTLKKEVYILDTYINVWIEKKKKEKQKDVNDIRIINPRAYWKKMKKVIITYDDEKRYIIINAMKILYQKYFEIIGNFSCYNIMNKIYNSTKSKKLKEIIKQLFYTSIQISDAEIKENNVRDINKENIDYINIS